uniref:Centromere protein H isoform X3 n=1 Tax=Geotrypetes seraphini TaxID=260995 RepID=A0A6P8PP38_GEOSA|nr:centromere protein H isoform X3 [Geotrypetes seraphini]
MALPAQCDQQRTVCVMQAPPIRATSATREDVTTLIRLGEQVSQQHMEYHTAVEAGEENTLDIIPEEKLIETTKHLEGEIEKARTSCYNKTLVLQRIQMSNAVLNRLKENDSESKEIQEVIKHVVMLCSSIMKSQQEAPSLEEQLYEVRKKRLKPYYWKSSQLGRRSTLKSHFSKAGEKPQISLSRMIHDYSQLQNSSKIINLSGKKHRKCTAVIF